MVTHVKGLRVVLGMEQAAAGFMRTLDDLVFPFGPDRTEEGSLAVCTTSSSLSYPH